MSQAAAATTSPGRSLPQPLRERLCTVQAEIPIDAGGGTSALKMLAIADLVTSNDLERVVEIGVYRGRLLVALGVLMHARQRGEAIGIDPYSAAAALQTDEHERSIDLVAWVDGVDWDAIHDDVLARIARHGATDRCRVLRKRSEQAVTDFAPGSIDLLHVDGNHDRAAVERDVALYLPMVRAGGFVVMDDAAWPSVRPICARLADEHELVFQLFDGAGTLDGVGGNDFAMFRLTPA